LAQAAFPAQLVTLILSDVIADPLDEIASGPTAPDGSTFDEACAVIAKYDLQKTLPSNVMQHLQRGRDGQVVETVKRDAPCFATSQNVIVGSNGQALVAAKISATQLGYAPRIVTDVQQGEARDVAHLMAQTVRNALDEMQTGERRCLLYGGETTVTVRGHGKGGRNQELAMAFAIEIDGMRGVSLLSAGTDGSDGPTDATGAMVDGGTATRASLLGLEPLSYLDNNDSWTFFQLLDAAPGASCHLKTGPTGTNVMDIQIVLLNKL
jgi:glycerate-2-kinase